jgi:hypothetical protein
MDIIEVKKQLINNPQHIVNILNTYNFYNVNKRGKEIRCGRNIESDGSSIRIRLQNNDDLYVDDFSHHIKGDLISFIIKVRQIEFRDIINTIKKELGIDSNFSYSKKKSAFGGFYDKIRSKKRTEAELKTYNENILEEYLIADKIFPIPLCIFLHNHLKTHSFLHTHIKFVIWDVG